MVLRRGILVACLTDVLPIASMFSIYLLSDLCSDVALRMVLRITRPCSAVMILTLS
jgi:hypothetical protein